MVKFLIRVVAWVDSLLRDAYPRLPQDCMSALLGIGRHKALFVALFTVPTGRVRGAAGVVAPGMKFNIFLLPHISPRLFVNMID